MKQLGIFVICLAFFSCKGDGSLMLPSASGEMGELVLVMSPQMLRSTPLKDSVTTYFHREMKGLPQGEQYFKVYAIDDDNFGNVFKIHRNVLMFTEKTDQAAPGYATKENAWAKGQLVVQILAKDADGFLEFFNKNKAMIDGIFWEKEMERMGAEFAKIANQAVCKDFETSTKVKMNIPEGFYTITTGKNFAYAKHEATKSAGKGLSAEINRGVLAYTFPYRSKGIFTKEKMLALRDSLTMANIKGSKDSSMMIVERRLPHDSTSFTWNGQLAMKMKGLWRINNEFKGGPYVSILTYDPKQNRAVFLDGFVYAPNFNKRNYIFQVEGILRSAKF